MSELNYVGKSFRRKDGPDKVTGRAVYTQDVKLPNTQSGRYRIEPSPNSWKRRRHHGRVRRPRSATRFIGRVM
jgi:CO/xanthine dehydrogenase Mo-binding subunit